MSRRRTPQRGARRSEPADLHAPVEDQLELFGDQQHQAAAAAEVDHHVRYTPAEVHQ